MTSKFQGNIVEDVLSEEFYYIYFEPSIFYESSPIDSQYQTIFHLIRRRHSKKTIINGIFDLIKRKNSVKVIKFIFNTLVNDYKLLLKPELMLSLTQNSLSTNISLNQIQNPLEMRNLGLLVNRKKMIIRQSDLNDDLFKLFIHNSYNENVIVIIELILFFISAVQKEKIQVHVMIISVLISLLRKVKDKRQLITMLIQYQSIPDNYEFASFLIREFYDYDEIHSLGLDMMKRLHKLDVIVLELFKKKRICEALLFAKLNRVTIDHIPEEIKDIIKAFIKHDNKKLLVDFLSA